MNRAAATIAPSISGRASARARQDPIPVWVVSAHAERCPVEERAVFARRARLGADRGRLVLETCHRVEVYGVGAPPTDVELAGLVDSPERIGVLVGEAAVRHAFRLAAGLESAVIGEDQVLHQVRDLRESARSIGMDGHLARLFEMAIGVGRRARSSRPERRLSTETLATRALDWLSLRAGLAAADEMLVVGAGAMGRLLAGEARRRGLTVVVASRTFDRAAAVAAQVRGRAVSLETAARQASEMRGVAIALAGSWSALADPGTLPPTVDLSSPPTIPTRGLADRLDIDGLYRWSEDPARELDAAFVENSVALVEESVAGYRRWSAGRASVQTLRALRGRAEERRRSELERLRRRLPNLTPREQNLLEAFSARLVGDLLHSPTAQLRDDVDGSAAAAARRLFDL
jgi:glutamyl-tRNA reductase